jgi:hypothetical protein
MAQIASERAMVAASQLEKIGFVDFTVDLVKGVYEIIVKASMDQLKAYADIVSQVSKDLTAYQADMIGADDSEELKAKVDSYIKDVLGLDPSSANDYTLAKEKADELTTHFSGVEINDTSTPSIKKGFAAFLAAGGAGGFTLKVADLKAFVKEKIKAGVKLSQDLLKTILKIGMQKVVVTNGEILTKLTFHVDASDESSKVSQQSNQKASGWGIGGGISAGTGPIARIAGGAVSGSLSGGYSNRKLSVSVVNEKSSAATNIQIDILGQVRILFRTDTFPSVDA